MSRNIPLASRDFQCDQNGVDTNDGQSIEAPLATLQEGVIRTLALSPVPGPGFPASVSVMGTGNFNGNGVVVPDWVSMIMPNASIVLDTDSTTNVECGDQQDNEFGNLSNSGDSTTILLITDDARIRNRVSSMVAGPFFGTTTNSVQAIKTTGACDDVFTSVEQIECRSEGAVLISHECSSPTPVIYDITVIDGFADNSVMFDYNPPNITDSAVFNFNTCSDNRTLLPANTTGIRSSGLGLLNFRGNILAHQIALEVLNNSQADGQVITVLGDIIVRTGGVANVFIINHPVGNVIVEGGGVLNGEIGGTRYGAWIESLSTFFNWFRSGGVPNVWTTFARVTIDADNYQPQGLEASFLKSTTTSHTVGFRLINEDTNDIYYTGSATTTSTGVIDVPMSVSVAFPITGDINVAMQVQRTAGPFFGVGDSSATLELA